MDETKHKTPPTFLRMDVQARRVWHGEQELFLTRLEHDLLEYLAERKGIVVTYQELCERYGSPSVEWERQK